MKLLLIDESKARNYILCVVELDYDLAPASRKVVNKSRLKGQSSVHFVNESESRKRQILQNFKLVDFDCSIYVVRGLKEADARAKCLKAIIENLQVNQNYSIVLDRNDIELVRDKKVIHDSLFARKMLEKVEYSHIQSRAESLLWIPDAIAWCAARGGQWKKVINEFSLSYKEVS